MLGYNCGIDDLVAVCKGNELCNKYGLDTISTGSAIAFAVECYENGIITKEDTEGVELRFGNVEAMLETIEKITRREGIGQRLREQKTGKPCQERNSIITYFTGKKGGLFVGQSFKLQREGEGGHNDGEEFRNYSSKGEADF